MSAEWIVNPRRAPRSHARCHAHIVAPQGAFDAETEDIGAHGCQVVAPRPVGRGEPLRLSITSDRLPDPLVLRARAAWASPDAPYRLGVAFDDGALDDSTRWFDRLVAASGLPPVRRVPERISADAMVYLGPPPRFLVDFNREEALILRAVGSGTTAGELRARLRDAWAAAQRALFSLLAHQHLTLSRGASVHPESWRRILTALEASLAVEDLRPPVPPPWPRPGASLPAAPAPTPPPVARASPAPTPPPGAGPVPARTPAPLATPVPHAPARAVAPGDSRSVARSLDGGGGWVGPRPPPDYHGAGVGWRAPRERPPEAQGCLDQAKLEIAAGRVHGALALLRRALALAPGDPEIAEELGKLAFKDRPPGR